jgi:hypothetical protein
MVNKFQLIDSLTRNPEQVAEALSTDTAVDLRKLRSLLVNLLQEPRQRNHNHNVIQLFPGNCTRRLFGE